MFLVVITTEEPVSDTTLIAAKDGDQEALAGIYRQYGNNVFRYILSRVGDQGTAEDLTADVFIRMIEKIGSYELRGKPFFAWLISIAHNIVIDHFRRQQRVEVGADQDLAENAASLEELDEVYVIEQYSELAGIINELPASQQQVIYFRFIEGFSERETALMLESTEGGVRSKQYRAMKTIRNSLNNYRENNG
jgi:RNA polymerase sigma-70 factor (ECF subfamily)